MDYPNVTLQISNNIPTIILQMSENRSKEMFKLHVGLDTYLMQMADKLEMDYDNLEDVFDAIREGDEHYIDFPDIEYGATDLDLSAVEDAVEDELTNYEDHPDANRQVKDELRTYHQHDVLASVLEEIYNILIAKTVHAASELGTGNIVLQDDRREVRLQEKITKELGEVDQINLVVIE